VESGGNFTGVTARVGHVPQPDAPSNRSVAVDPRHRQARPENAKRGLHAQSESKGALARKDHAPSSGDQHD
jgi:hypothetical protein